MLQKKRKSEIEKDAKNLMKNSSRLYGKIVVNSLQFV